MVRRGEPPNPTCTVVELLHWLSSVGFWVPKSWWMLLVCSFVSGCWNQVYHYLGCFFSLELLPASSISIYFCCLFLVPNISPFFVSNHHFFGFPTLWPILIEAFPSELSQHDLGGPKRRGSFGRRPLMQPLKQGRWSSRWSKHQKMNETDEKIL